MSRESDPIWSRNLPIYRLTQDLQLDADSLEKALDEKPTRLYASQELITYGFTTLSGKGLDASLIHVNQNFFLTLARKGRHILPGDAVRDALKEKVDETEARQIRKVYKKERNQLKDEIIQTLLLRAFTRHSSTFAATMSSSGLALVDSVSAKKAEDLLLTLREALDSLPVHPLSAKVALITTLTDWVKIQETIGDFHVFDECELRNTHEDGGAVRCECQGLTSEEIQLYPAAGKLVTQLFLVQLDKLFLVLDDKLVVKCLRFKDLLQEQAEKDSDEDVLDQLDTGSTLIVLTFAGFPPVLFEALGGGETPQGVWRPTLLAVPAAGGITPGMVDWRPSSNKESPCVS